MLMNLRVLSTQPVFQNPYKYIIVTRFLWMEMYFHLQYPAMIPVIQVQGCGHSGAVTQTLHQDQVQQEQSLDTELVVISAKISHYKSRFKSKVVILTWRGRQSAASQPGQAGAGPACVSPPAPGSQSHRTRTSQNHSQPRSSSWQ